MTELTSKKAQDMVCPFMSDSATEIMCCSERCMAWCSSDGTVIEDGKVVDIKSKIQTGSCIRLTGGR